jgi:hypothetical protein
MGADTGGAAPGDGVTASRGRAMSWLADTRWDGWIETIAVLLLATASLAAAWSGYQAALWGGEQATLFSQASARRVQATQASTNAYLYTLIDLDAFNNFAGAYASGDDQLMAVYRRQFSDRLAPAVEAWLATDPLHNPDAPDTPLAMKEYVVPARADAARLEAEAEDLFERGVDANEQGDGYVLNTVYLATALFFGGIVTRVKSREGRAFLDALGVGLLVFGVYHVATLPVA